MYIVSLTLKEGMSMLSKILQYHVQGHTHILQKVMIVRNKTFPFSCCFYSFCHHQGLIVARSATHSAAMGLISSRDFVDLIMIKRYDDGIVTTNSKSIQRKDCPPKEGFVRGTNYNGGTVCIPVKG